jgi:hypothetical protein
MNGTGVQLLGSVLGCCDESDRDAMRRALRAGARNARVVNIFQSVETGGFACPVMACR